jgi:polar amino acid transport system substrate-binding protein
MLLLTGFSTHALAAEKPELVVAISLDMPPYVMDQAAGGLEVDIARSALKDYSLHFIQIPYGELQDVVQQKRADAALGVEAGDKDIFYSNDFIVFVNYAISKKADGFRIDSVADLSNHRVLTWGNAYLELGGEFEALFSPQSPQRKNYVEFADQKEQVRRFWEGKGLVIVIDHSIFTHFSRMMGHDLNEVSIHAIFPPVTNFRAGFRDAAVRDRFDEGLAALCKSGEYAELLRRYGVEAKHSVCQ